MALSRRAIIDAGLGILDAYGLGDLTMRRLAEVLGVQAGALYYHVPNKQSLLAALSDEILLEIREPAADSTTRQWLTDWAQALREALLAHRDGAELVATSLALGLGTRKAQNDVETRLADSGLREPGATAATLLHFVLGHVVEEQTRAQMSSLGVIAAFDQEASDRRFRLGVRIVVVGALVLDGDGARSAHGHS